MNGTHTNRHLIVAFYQSGLTQREVGERFGVSQKAVFGILRRAGVQCRKAAKRFQSGSANAYWKGSSAGYQAFHRRMEAIHGSPKKCETCGISDKLKYYDWANLSGRYDDPSDYKRLCRSCHRNYDNSRRKGVVSHA